MRASFLFTLAVILLAGCASPDGRPRALDSGHEGVLERIARARAASRSPSSAELSEDDPQPHHSHFPALGGGDEVVSNIIPKKMVRIALGWPVRNPEVTSVFGLRGKEFHEGIDLRAKSGTAIYAAHSGVVIYADRRIRGYGQMIVLKHLSGLATVYAHNSRILVRRGQQIHQGQQIAISGKTGHVSGPHLHFEVRRGIAALDPMKFLPKPGRGHQAAAAAEVLEPEPVRAPAPGVKLTTSHD
ncbi:MAG: M23 family metallopeptidase [Bdellovibrionota bacterium]